MLENEYTFYGIGKRKSSVAKIFLKKGSGQITVNKSLFENSFCNTIEERDLIKVPLLELAIEKLYDVDIIVKGGGISSQLEATRLAIAKAICKITPEFRQRLSQKGFLNRDARIKERRKYGLRKARKAPQYSKR